MRRSILNCAAALAAVVFSHYGLRAQRTLPIVPGSRTAVPIGAQSSPQAAAALPPAGLTAARANALIEARRRGLSYLPGEVLVKFKRGVSPAGRERALSAVRSHTPSSQWRWMGDVAKISDDTLPFSEITAAELAVQPEVEFAHPNYIRRIPDRIETRELPLRVGASPQGTPNDPDYRDLQWNLSLLNMPAAWEISPGGSPAVTVAVVDTGLTMTSDTLVRTLWTGSRFELVGMLFQPSPDISASRLVLARDFAFEPGTPMRDFDGHGTHVASTIAEEANNQLSLAGMAYQVKIMPVKVCVGFWEIMIKRAALGQTGYVPSDAGACADDDIIAGIRYAADNGAKVINISLGGPDFSSSERDAIQYAVQQGAFVAVAMGNESEKGNIKEYPAGYSSIEGLMSVGAVGKSKTRAYYSATGGHLEIVAPGGSDRDGGGLDQGFVWQVTLRPNDQDAVANPKPRFDRYAEVGYIGTSMSTPHVSAMAALLMSRGVTDPKAVEAVIKASALDLGTPGRDDQFGFGLIQPRVGLFGFGVKR
ncbi:MAG: S8 family serine peptidase [Vicinamibacterales bacterium]